MNQLGYKKRIDKHELVNMIMEQSNKIQNLESKLKAKKIKERNSQAKVPRQQQSRKTIHEAEDESLQAITQESER